MEEMQEQMEDTMSKMQIDLNNIMGELSGRANEIMDKGRDKIKEKPLTYVGVAFGVGLIAGAILIKALEKK